MRLSLHGAGQQARVQAGLDDPALYALDVVDGGLGAGGDDFGGGLTAMLRREPAEGENHRAKLLLAAIAGEDADEIGGDRVEFELRSERGERLAGFVAAHQRACDQLGEVLGIEQRLVKRIEASAEKLASPIERLALTPAVLIASGKT